jgi:hypothetical protein
MDLQSSRRWKWVFIQHFPIFRVSGYLSWCTKEQVSKPYAEGGFNSIARMIKGTQRPRQGSFSGFSVYTWFALIGGILRGIKSRRKSPRGHARNEGKSMGGNVDLNDLADPTHRYYLEIRPAQEEAAAWHDNQRKVWEAVLRFVGKRCDGFVATGGRHFLRELQPIQKALRKQAVDLEVRVDRMSGKLTPVVLEAIIAAPARELSPVAILQFFAGEKPLLICEDYEDLTAWLSAEDKRVLLKVAEENDVMMGFHLV